MADWWHQFKSIFQPVSAVVSSPTQPIVHELVQQTDSEKADYQHWKNTVVCRNLVNWLYHQYQLFKSLPSERNEAIVFIQQGSVSGFMIYFHKLGYSARDVNHFWYWLQEQIKSHNYRSQVTDKRIYEKKGSLETLYRSYLKPKPHILPNKKIDQAFGNITLELLCSGVNCDTPQHLQCRAVTYQDRLFDQPGDFSQLMEWLHNQAG